MSCGFFLMHFHCVYLFCPCCRTQSESWNLSWKMLNMTWAVIWGSTRTFSMSKWHWMLKFIPTGTSLITHYFTNHFTVHLIMNSQDQQSLLNRYPNLLSLLDYVLSVAFHTWFCPLGKKCLSNQYLFLVSPSTVQMNKLSA